MKKYRLIGAGLYFEDHEWDAIDKKIHGYGIKSKTGYIRFLIENDMGFASSKKDADSSAFDSHIRKIVQEELRARESVK